MSNHDMPPEVAVWTDSLRGELVAAILRQMGPRIRVTAIGHGQPPALAPWRRSEGVHSFDDFRRMMIDQPAAFVLLATMEGVRPEDLAAAQAAGAVVFALEPVHDSLDALTQSESRRDGSVTGGGGGGGRLIEAPAFTASPGWVAMPDPRDALGELRQLHIELTGAEADASLWARLCDAWATVLHLNEMPETIDASLVGPLTSVPDDPRGLTGYLSAHGRAAGNVAITLAVSDRSPAHGRSARLLGLTGRLLVSDLSFEAYDAQGGLIDRGPAGPTQPAPPAPDGDGPLAAALLAQMWRKTLDHPALLDAWPRGPQPAQILACALASHLSTRTRQPESPAAILRMHRRA